MSVVLLSLRLLGAVIMAKKGFEWAGEIGKADEN